MRWRGSTRKGEELQYLLNSSLLVAVLFRVLRFSLVEALRFSLGTRKGETLLYLLNSSLLVAVEV